LWGKEVDLAPAPGSMLASSFSVIFDAELRLLAHSDAFGSTAGGAFGTDAAERFFSLIHPEDTPGADYLRAVAAGRIPGGGRRVRVLDGDGSWSAFDVRCDALTSAEGGRGLLVTMHRSEPPAMRIPDVANLSEREVQILGLVADGLRVSTIAKELLISPSTVRNHLSAIFHKVGVANQAELLELLRRANRV
jgi:DNA-binding CsgD family transcriptional regulator